MRLAYIIFSGAIFALGCESDTPIVQQPPSDPEILIAHNKWRSWVGVADLEWSEDLAKKAMALVDGSSCEWTINSEGLGQNFISSGTSATQEDLVDSWARGFQYYIYDLDSCTFPLLGGHPDDFCNSYKQVVWGNSTFLGCASASCLDVGRSVWVCLYDPPGNIPGEKPY